MFCQYISCQFDTLVSICTTFRIVETRKIMSEKKGNSSDGSETATDPGPLLSTKEILARCRQLLAIKEQQASTELKEIKERLLMAISNPSLTHFHSLASFEDSSIASRSRSGSSSSRLSLTSTSTSTNSPDYRTHMLWDYEKVPQDGGKVQPQLGALPADIQQRYILKDVLHCLVGMRGTYILPQSPDTNSLGNGDGETSFTINCQLDRSMREVVQNILPLATYFMGIQRMMAASDGHGQVLNALNYALQDLTRDFYKLISQADEELQRQQMTVLLLQYYLQPTMWVMEEIWKVLRDIQLGKCRGAAVLDLLYGRIGLLEGNEAAQQLMTKLTNAAAVPYMRKLQLWIHTGQLVDHTKEFLVQDNGAGRQYTETGRYADDYWEKRYTVRPSRVPTFLTRYTDKILNTGKYLNVIRQCGKATLPIQQMNLEEQLAPTSGGRIEKVINEAYHFAAGMLLDVLLKGHDLMGHLQSVKNYLLLGQGDFITQFMDACETELSKPVDDVQPMILENLLGLTLRFSLARQDPYSDYVHCDLLTYDLVTQLSKIMGRQEEEEYGQSQTRREDLSGIECFSFSYETKWPCSIVINQLAISKYQMLFRQLFFCKHAERQMCKIWKLNDMPKDRPWREYAELHRSLCTLRQRMMNAIQNIEYYMIYEVIVPNWHLFNERLKTVKNVELVLKHHQDFLDGCLKSCVMTESSHLSRAIFKLCKICIDFCDYIQLESLLQPSESFAERVNYFDWEFQDLLVSFLHQIKTSAWKNRNSFINLVHRINFNGFYTDQMEKLRKQQATEQDQVQNQDQIN
ncbi:gamma-tubulin complex component 2 homolog [Drosophila obscura]|uniref:gamma-tubulin complex component 2 homolog n=1 Tax=Drosophila obscura TaxID=7282 RepID=UPI001BB25685|nr:gamma-tubulin complex component 2 homolog [Drosophila obscura]